MLGVLEKAGIEVVALGESATKFGAVESFGDARKCAALFKKMAPSSFPPMSRTMAPQPGNIELP